jgi:hypothetical protein
MNASLTSSPGFVRMLADEAVRFVVASGRSASKDNARAQRSAEHKAFSLVAPALKHVVDGQRPLQMTVLYAAQVICHELHFPQGTR